MPATKEERAVFGEGFGNGLIVLVRRLMAQGLLPLVIPSSDLTGRDYLPNRQHMPLLY